MRCTKQYRLSYTEKAQGICDRLTLEQKVSLMSGNISIEDMMKLVQEMSEENHYNVTPYEAGGMKEEKIPSMKFVDGPRGVVCGNGQATCFPVSMGRGATFDIELEEKIGEAIATEVKAFGGNTFAGVCINLPYHPGWGRSQETYGEESFHIGRMGSALVKGVQNRNVIACIKHYAFNQMECSRFKVNVDCDKRTEREVFLPHFKDCIDAGAASVMSSYNLYKGVHCGHSKYLLQDVLKQEWDFDGFVMSDFAWGVRDTVEAANGGQDMEMNCTTFFGDKLVRAVQDGFVPEARVSDAALRIIRTLLAFTEAKQEEEGGYEAGTPEHIALAKKCAQESITLIQNRYSVLPFSKEQIRHITVIGTLAGKENTGDHGSSQVRAAYVKTPLQGLKETVPQAEVEWFDGTDREAARLSAQKADAVLFIAGFDHDDEGEYISDQVDSNYTGSMGGDRTGGLGLHEEEIRMIQEIGPVNPNSAVILIGGNTILTEEWKSAVNGILMAYYPGQEGGTAIAEILFGDVNPSGKLPFVIPVREEDLPSVDWDTSSQWYEYYHGYARLEKMGIKPSVPFGYGMSYTRFGCSDMCCQIEGEQLKAECAVKNMGSLAGDEVVQLYVGFRYSRSDRPVKLLRGFRRISLQPGEEKRVEILCPLEKLKWYNPISKKWELEAMEYEIYMGNSSAPEDLLQKPLWIK